MGENRLHPTRECDAPPALAPRRKRGIAVLRTTIATLLLAIASSSVSGQEWADKMFKIRTHDFGTVARNSQQVFHFELQNIYKEDIHISGVRASCGCTTPSISKHTLKTWEKGAIIAKYNTDSFLGKKSATLTVTIDKPFYAEVQLNVAGYIRSDIVFNPGAVHFGEVDPGTPAVKKVNLGYAGSTNWKVTDVRSNFDHLEVALDETGRGDGRVNYQLTVQLNGTAPAGYINDYLYLVTNEGNKAIPLAVTGQVKPAVTISPASLFMGTLEPGASATKQLIVRAKKPFRIENIRCGDNCFKFTPSEEAKALHIVPVTFTADASGKVAVRIAIDTDLAGGTAEFVASATVKDTPRVAEGG